MEAATSFAYRAPTVRRRRAPARLALWAGVPALALIAVPIVPLQNGDPGSAAAGVPRGTLRPTIAGGEIQPLTGAVMPAALALDVAPPFVAQYKDSASALRAERCLTEAIYYEGAMEPEAGQRAIAQVVLNRVRHPAYPDSVCGVVFQGQERSTGCQFTFTCDGARARPPMPSLWRRANLIAKAALGGAVVPEVGLSTHYHADYVNPYWSSSLNPEGQIGRHMFYRWRGGAGEAPAFSMRYSGREPLVAAWTPRPAGPAAGAVPGEAQMAGTPGSGIGAAGTAAGRVTGTLMPGGSEGAAGAEAPAPAPTPFRARPLLLTKKADSPA